MLKKIISLLVIFAMLVPFSSAVAADETTSQPTIDEEKVFRPEYFTYEELLSMDRELDSDGDGLVDVIELVYGFNRFEADTDGDGVIDYTEFCITCTDVLVPDGEIDTDGDGLTNAQEAIYGTNPDDLDTDNDTFGDYEEIIELHTDPLVKDAIPELSIYSSSETEDWYDPTLLGNSTYAIDVPVIDDGGLGGSSTVVYSGTLHTQQNDNTYTSSVSYSLDFGLFFGDNTVYRKDIATVSSLLSAIAYENNYLEVTSGGSFSSSADTAVWDWMDFHGFTHFANSYDLRNNYSDQHVSEMFIGHQTVTYGGATKNIICVVIRGTNGTLDEWQSNFDLGSTNDFNSTPGWTSSSNHMGFDITVNRLNTILTNYLYGNQIQNEDNVFWITGHSRGGALANILAAKRINDGDEVFAYTFAAPATTERTTAADKEAVRTNYPNIFNIINTDDLVPQLPMYGWNFVRYGVDKTASIEDSYASQWDNLVSGNDTYASYNTAIISAVNILSNIAENRNECYAYRNDESGYLAGSSFDYDYAKTMCSSMTITYPLCVYGYWYSTINYRAATIDYEYRIYHQPAFLMQLMGYAMSGTDIDGANFALISVAEFLAAGKSQIINLRNFIKHPHYSESYYLLASKIT